MLSFFFLISDKDLDMYAICIFQAEIRFVFACFPLVALHGDESSVDDLEETELPSPSLDDRVESV